MDWQRQVWQWNYLGVLMNYVLFLFLFWHAKHSITEFGLTLGTWRNYLSRYIALVTGVLALARIADFAHLTFHIPSLSTIFFQLVFVAWGEELLWRGYIQTVYGFWYASAGFGLLHFIGSLYSGGSLLDALIYGFVAFLMGMLLGYVRKKTETVHASALLHGLYNVANHFFS